MRGDGQVHLPGNCCTAVDRHVVMGCHVVCVSWIAIVCHDSVTDFPVVSYHTGCTWIRTKVYGFESVYYSKRVLLGYR